jgi:preprotein translocase subunit YajC
MNIFTNYLHASESVNQATTAARPSMFEQMIPFLLIFIAMYFLMIRPQTKKAKEHQQLLKELKAGDEVVTSGGILGRIKSISDNFVAIEVGGATLKVLKENISRATKKS